jgi:transposase
MRLYIGLDVHCKRTVYVTQDEDGKVVGQGSISTAPEGFNEMVNSLGVPAGTKIGLESGIQATWVSRYLCCLGMEPVVIDAREVRAKARRLNQKCDTRDAFDICDGLRRGIYVSIVYVPGFQIERLRQIISRRRHFVRLCTSQVNAARFLLRSCGIGSHSKSLRTSAAWEKLLESPAIGSMRDHLAMHQDLWHIAHENVLSLEKELRVALEPFCEVVARLQTAPGVGLITAATYIAVLGKPERFPTSGHVVSYIGFAPSSWDSADKVRRGHITKRGSSELRGVLCEAAHHAGDARHPLHPYFARICARHGYKKAVVAVAQRLARILFQMWLRSEDFDVTKLNVIGGRRIRTKTIYFRIKRPKEAVVAR